MRDLTDEGRVDPATAVRCMDYGFADAHRLKPEDLVFRARGSNNKAAFAAEVPEATVLASPLVRIRVKTPAVHPRYLQWFINLPTSQAYLGSGSQGSLVRMVSIEHLAKLELVIPILEEQRRVVELEELSAKEAAILRRLAELAELRGRLAITDRLFISQRSDHDE